jgi:O-antigen/teichoic acid export membrane protein
MAGSEGQFGSQVSSSNLATQIMYYSFAAFVPATLTLLSSSVFTRMFSTGAYGLYTVVVTVVLIMSATLSQWLQQPINRYIPGMSRSERHEFLGLVSSFLIAICIVVILGAALASTILRHSTRVLPYVIPTAIYLGAQVWFTVLGTVLQADFQARRYASIQTLNSIIRFAVSLVFALWIFKSPVALVWGIDSGLLLLIPVLLFTSNVLNSTNGSYIDLRDSNRRKLFYKITSYGLPMVGFFLAMNILGLSDRIIIGVIRGPSEVGIYSASYSLISGGVGLLTAPVITAAHPFLMRAWSLRDEKNAARWLGTIASNILSLGIITIGGVWLLAPFLARVFLGVNFRSGSSIMPIVVAGLVAMSFATYAHKPFEFRERTSFMMVLAVCVAIANLFLNVLFVPRFGYVASAWVTLFCYLLYAVITVALGQRLLRWNISWKELSLVVMSVATGLAATKLLQGELRGHYFWLEFPTIAIVYMLISSIPIVFVNRGHLRKMLFKSKPGQEPL